MADINGNIDQDELAGYGSGTQYLQFGAALSAFQLFDGLAPVVTPTTPTAVTGQTTAVTFAVSDETQLRGVCVIASYVGSNTRELVWDSTHGFNGFYLGTANTQVATLDAGGNVLSRAFSILRDGGWPANITLTVFAFDDGGNAAGGF